MNVLEQIEKKKSENLIFMAYCYKFNIELDILTLKLIVLIKFLIFKIHSKEL